MCTNSMQYAHAYDRMKVHMICAVSEVCSGRIRMNKYDVLSTSLLMMTYDDVLVMIITQKTYTNNNR